MNESITEREQYEQRTHRSSHLFLLRVWIKRKSENHTLEDSDLAGKVQDPVSGQVQYFHGWMELVQIIYHTISEKEAASPANATDIRQP